MTIATSIAGRELVGFKKTTGKTSKSALLRNTPIVKTWHAGDAQSFGLKESTRCHSRCFKTEAKTKRNSGTFKSSFLTEQSKIQVRVSE